MDEVTLRRMTAAEFFEWEPGDDRRYELVDGIPVIMARARAEHDQIVVNILTELRTKLRDTGYRAFTADIAVLIPKGNVRCPDAGVNQGPLTRGIMHAEAPCIVFEVLSPSTRNFDLVVKLDEYKTVELLQHIVLVDPDIPRALHWSRGVDRAWRHQVLEGLSAAVEFHDPPIMLSISALYADVDLTPPP
jgi:Uma2 family endonuclease